MSIVFKKKTFFLNVFGWPNVPILENRNKEDMGGSKLFGGMHSPPLVDTEFFLIFEKSEIIDAMPRT